MKRLERNIDVVPTTRVLNSASSISPLRPSLDWPKKSSLQKDDPVVKAFLKVLAAKGSDSATCPKQFAHTRCIGRKSTGIPQARMIFNKLSAPTVSLQFVK
jgi:hypothetical protein